MYNETSTDSSPVLHFPTSIIMAAAMLLMLSYLVNHS